MLQSLLKATAVDICTRIYKSHPITISVGRGQALFRTSDKNGATVPQNVFRLGRAPFPWNKLVSYICFYDWQTVRIRHGPWSLRAIIASTEREDPRVTSSSARPETLCCPHLGFFFQNGWHAWRGMIFLDITWPWQGLLRSQALPFRTYNSVHAHIY